MWNPDTYRDSDYGLDPSETFEPRDDLEEEYRPRPGDPYVMTVLGPVRPDEIGLALVREHLQWRPATGDAGDTLNDPMAALADLEAFFTVSGRTVVSATPAGAGRDARALLGIAQRAPVHIVAATGHLGHEEGSTLDVLAAISRDLTDGMDGTVARPGVMVVGGPEEEATAAEVETAAAIGERYNEHDLPVLSIAPPRRQREAVERLATAGVPAGRVIVAGAGQVPAGDIGPLIERGAWLLFDGIGLDTDADLDQGRRIVGLVAEGNGGRILLSHGYRRRALLTGYQGRPGLSYVVEQFAVMLLEEGLEALDVRRMLVDNAAAALTTVATVSGAQTTHREGRM